MNERIRAREVRLIDENGGQLGVMSAQEALRVARERELDLIEVAPNAQPPVCRIMDFGKHKYQVSKREREARRKHKATEVRLLRMKPQIGDHDLQIKLRKLRELLEEGNKVRINLRFRGRELRRPELGTKLFDRIVQELSDIAQTEGGPRFEGRMMNLLVSPKPRARPPAPKKERPAREKQPVTPDVGKDVKEGQVEAQAPKTEDTEDSGEAG